MNWMRYLGKYFISWENRNKDDKIFNVWNFITFLEFTD